MRRIYNSHSTVDFGMFKGYELGIVYAFSPDYIEWCINNIGDFCVTDLDELKDIGVVNQKLDWQYNADGDASKIPLIDEFENFEHYKVNHNHFKERGAKSQYYSFKDESLQKNRERVHDLN